MGPQPIFDMSQNWQNLQGYLFAQFGQSVPLIIGIISVTLGISLTMKILNKVTK